MEVLWQSVKKVLTISARDFTVVSDIQEHDGMVGVLTKEQGDDDTQKAGNNLCSYLDRKRRKINQIKQLPRKFFPKGFFQKRKILRRAPFPPF